MRMTPDMTAGVLIGTASARHMPIADSQILFIVFISIIAIRTLVGIRPKPSRTLSRLAGLNVTGVLFGMVSSQVGIGSSSLSVPFPIYYSIPPHKAVGTSSDLVWPITLVGTVGCSTAGRHIPNLPDGAVDFLYLPAITIPSVTTIVFAPLSVKTAHKLPPETLETAFGLLPLAIAARMLWKTVQPLPHEMQTV